MTELTFTINWYEVAKVAGAFVLGIIVVVLFLMWKFRNWRVF